MPEVGRALAAGPVHGFEQVLMSWSIARTDSNGSRSYGMDRELRAGAPDHGRFSPTTSSTTRPNGHHQQKFRFPRRSGSIPSRQTERRQGCPSAGDGRFDPVTCRSSSRFREQIFARRLTTWDPFMVRSGCARYWPGHRSAEDRFTLRVWRKPLWDSFSKRSACLIGGPVRFRLARAHFGHADRRRSCRIRWSSTL